MRKFYAQIFREIRAILEPKMKGEAVFEEGEDREKVYLLVTAHSDALKNAGLPAHVRGDNVVCEFLGTRPDDMSGDISMRFNGGLPMFIRFVNRGQLSEDIRLKGARAVAEELLEPDPGAFY